MIPKLLLAVLATLCSLCNVYAQHSTINGHIKNAVGNPLGGSSLLLYRFTDSLLIKTAIADTKGNYEIMQVKAGTYFITASFTGYSKLSTIVFGVPENEKVIIPAISLQIDNKKMQDVTVTSTYQKPIIEVTADKTIFNVESSINATGSNAFELLQKSPGVVTDKDDNIILKGKNGVRIYIDGRPTEMDAAGVAAYLKSINSADIGAIEIISNPSAKYDASGNAGIINIKLKKNKGIGFNGSVSGGINIGTNIKTNGSFNSNYRNKSVNIYSNYSNNWNNNDNTFDLYRIQNDTLYDQKSFQNIKGWTNNIKAGVDFFINKKSTLGFIFTGNFTDNITYSYSRTPSSATNTGVIDRILYASNTIPANIKNENFNVNYHYADTTGYEINIDADHGFYKSRKTSYQPNAYYTHPPETLLYEKNYRNNTPTNITINTQKIDYIMPFKKGQLSVGAKVSNVKTDNVFNLYEVLNGNDFIDLNRSNSFFYKENINSAYINYAKPLSKKINLQAGLRVENTSSKSQLTRADGMRQSDGIIDRNYTDLFPSAAFTYVASVNQLFNLNYSRRIDRPNYSDLNPFEARVDELTYIKGNAFLQPQYTNTLQLTHTFKSRFITAIGFSRVNDFSTYILDSTEKTRTFITKKNLARQDIANLSFSLPFDITKWWNLYSSINLYNSSYKANFGPGKIVDINVTSYNLYAQNMFKLGGGFTGELSGFYNGPSVSAGTFKTKPLGSVDVGIEKKLFSDKATIKLSYTDFLHTLQWQAKSNYSGTYLRANSVWESRQFRLNFTYLFGSKQIKGNRMHDPGNEEEKIRAATSGGLNGQ